MERTRGKVVARFEGALRDRVLAERLEKCLWNWTVRGCARDGIPLYWDNPRYRYRYTTRALGLEFNLKNPKNPELLRRVTERELSVKALVGLTPQEMWPENWDSVYERIAQRQLRREADVDASKAPDGAYTCGRCKSKKTVYTSLQIRSADEPMTNFVRCLNCGKSWKD
jgi:transcription elongation factor S-II